MHLPAAIAPGDDSERFPLAGGRLVLRWMLVESSPVEQKPWGFVARAGLRFCESCRSNSRIVQQRQCIDATLRRIVADGSQDDRGSKMDEARPREGSCRGCSVILP